ALTKGGEVRLALPDVSGCAVATGRYSSAQGLIHTIARKRRRARIVSGPNAAPADPLRKPIGLGGHIIISCPRNCHRRVTFGSADPKLGWVSSPVSQSRRGNSSFATAVGRFAAMPPTSSIPATYSRSTHA